MDNTGANPKRAISSVKYAQAFFDCREEERLPKNIPGAKFYVLQFSGRAAM